MHVCVYVDHNYLYNIKKFDNWELQHRRHIFLIFFFCILYNILYEYVFLVSFL